MKTPKKGYEIPKNRANNVEELTDIIGMRIYEEMSDINLGCGKTMQIDGRGAFHIY